MMAMMNYTISHSQFPQTASGCMMPTDLPWMSEPSVGTNLIHGEKCVISRNVSENCPISQKLRGKEFKKFTGPTDVISRCYANAN